MKNIVLKNAIIVDPSQKINSKGSIVIKDKIICDLILNKDISFDKNVYHIIDCKNLMLCPGFVDIKCHLRVPGEEHKEYSKDLTNILKWMEELKEVDVSNVQPVTSVTKNELYEREDISNKKTVEQEKILLNAPEKVGEYFTVPKVIE